MAGPEGPPRVQFTNNGSPVLPPRNSMNPGQYLESPNKRFKLILQTDMNLVLYDNGTAVWVADSNTPYSSTLSNPVAKVPNSFYVFESGVLSDHVHVRIWSTVNSTPPDSVAAAAYRNFLQVQDDGNIVIVDSRAIWNGTPSIPLDPGGTAFLFGGPTELVMGVPYFAGDGALIFQGDGNVVNYGPNWSVRWASYTQNKGATRAVFQADGNFVVYAANNVPLWNSGTGGNPGATLRLQPNGSLAVVQEVPVWARFGYTPTIRRRKIYYPNNASPEHNGTDPYPTYGHIGWEF
ncbi:putidacin L1 family lectin-like bacteriocin [Pseudomonas sp.]|jgi:hypothetical protein|uniref:putidacin L1 family lectin-like bacteriocin n=1 Tax=Pseudomonas sp. TaxID=306 RepID=UPI003D6FF84B